MPPVKELNYLDRSPDYPSRSSLAEPDRFRRLCGWSQDARGFRHLFVDRLRRDLKNRSWDDLRWDLRYFCGRAHDAWYESLFAPAGDRLSGEATPEYCLLEPADLNAFRRGWPATKAILVLRNPIERSWSGFRLNHGPELADPAFSEAKMRSFFDTSHHRRRSDYLAIIDRLEAAFPRRQLHLCFFDHLNGDPARFYREVCAFLSVSTDRGPSSLALSQAKNVRPAHPIPPAIARHLAAIHLRTIEGLADRFGDPAVEWRAQAHRILGRSTT